MKVLLVNPENLVKGMNLGLGMIHRQLADAGFEVLHLDLNNTPPRRGFAAVAKEFLPDFLLVSVDSFTSGRALSLARQVRRVSKAVTVAGGPLLNLDAANFRSISECFDYGLVGDGELTAVRLLRALARGRRAHPVKGVVRCLGDRLAFSGMAERAEDLDALGPPLYPEESYAYMRRRPFFYTLLTSRGCPYRCVFCPNPILQGRRWRARSADSVLSEIRELHDVHGIDSFSIVDDNFTLDRDRAKAILRGLLSLRFKVRFELGNGIRADTVDEELASLLKASGCLKVPIGVENADPKTYRLVDKGISLTRIRQAFRLLKKHRLNTEAFMIIGLIGADQASLDESLRFIKEMGILARWYIAMPLPQTRFYDWVLGHGRLLAMAPTQGTWSGKPPLMLETDKLSAADLLRNYYYLNAEVGNFLFLSEGRTMPTRLVSALRNLLIYDPRQLPAFLAWCLRAAVYREDFVMNRLAS